MTASSSRLLVFWTLVAVFGCSAAADPSASQTSGVDERAEHPSLDDVDDLPGKALSFDVAGDEVTYVSLRDVAVVSDTDAHSSDWDLAFRGWDVFTNSGPSGPGQGGGFGPLDETDFLTDGLPEVPFIRADTTGGAFLGWYAYDSSAHQLWSRYHVYGVRQGERYWKLQILSYYGEQFDAPVSALYRLRYAEVTAGGDAQTRDLSEIDATAGYPEVDDTQPSGCLDLESAQIEALRPDQARASKAWHLCFRRDAISVNGEEGGPGEVSAIDLDSAHSADESLADIQQRTATSERAAFDAVDLDQLTDPDLHYRGDRVVSIFDNDWFDGHGETAEPRGASWLVIGADGERFYLVVFREIRGSADASGQVTLQVREVTE